MKKLTLFTIILFSFLSTNAHAHVKTLICSIFLMHKH